MAFIPACWDWESLDMPETDPIPETMEVIHTTWIVQCQTEWYYQGVPFSWCILTTHYRTELMQRGNKSEVFDDILN